MVPVVQEFALGDWPATAQSLRSGARRELAQAWKVPPEADFQPGEIWMGVLGQELAVYAVLRDDKPANRAVQWNEPTRINSAETQREVAMRIPNALVLDMPRADGSRRFR